MKLAWMILLLPLMIFIIGIVSATSYAQGQKDALQGKQQFEIVTCSDSTTLIKLKSK